MSLDHDLQNLPRLSDEDREPSEDQYSIIPALISDEATARDYSDVDRGDGAGTNVDVPSQPSAANDEPDSIELQIDTLLETLLGVTAKIGVAARSMCDEEEYDCELQRVLFDTHKELKAIGWQLGNVGTAAQKLDALRSGLREVIHG